MHYRGMGHTYILTTLALAFALASHVATGQTLNTWGVIIGGAYNLHDATFQRLGSYPSCCPTFTDGTGAGYSLGGFYKTNLFKSVDLESRLILNSENGVFTYDERSVVADIRDSLRVVRATFQHQLDASILSLGIEPLLSLRLSKALQILAGPRISTSLVQDFTQTETLTQPEDYGAYLGKDRSWINTQATIPDVIVPRVSLLAGLRIQLPLNERSPLNIGIEALYSHGLSAVSRGTDWSIHQVRFAATIGFKSVNAGKPPIDTCLDCKKNIAAQRDIPADTVKSSIAQTDTTIVKSEVPSIAVAQVVDSVIQHGAFSIYEHRRRVVVLHPLLGHVYFNEGSNELPERYKNGIRKALLDTLSLTPLVALQGELAIIAQRMKRHPDAWLAITGTTSSINADQGVDLARLRAETVRDNMISLGVAQNRMRVSARVYPERPTTFSDPTAQRLAQEENRRVELSSNNPAILAPVRLGVVERLFYPEQIAVILSTSDSNGQSARVVLARNADTLFSISSTDRIRDDTLCIDTKDVLSKGNGNLTAMAEYTASGRSNPTRDVRTVPIVQDEKEYTRIARQGDLEIERYGLILFEFDEVRISKQHERQLQFIRDRIRENTIVTIIGATDQIGTGEYNKELSLKRAREVARKLGISQAIVVGNGEDNPSLPNDLPEGRASNRTVVIQLATPVK